MNKKTWELLPFWFPKSQNNRNWTFVFIILTFLSIDWWNWDSNARFADWIPIWIIYLIFIQFALAYSVWKFSKVFSTIVEGNEMFIPEEQELIKNNDDLDNKPITNIYISDSVINRSIIGEKDDKDE